MKSKKGYSLVEVVVVMGIIAVLMLLGVGVFVSIRDQYIVDAATEEAITAVREAQNRAISFSQGSAGNTKAWAVNFSSSEGIRLRSLSVDPENNEAIHSNEIGYGISRGVVISSNNDHIYFASPFGTTHLFNSECNSWLEDEENPSHEFVPSCGNTLTAPATISFSYKGKSSSIVINGAGDVHAE